MRASLAGVQRRGNSFTLIEVIIASFIIGIGVFGLYSTMMETYKSIHLSKLRVEADTVAYDKAREFLVMPMDTLVAKISSYSAATAQETIAGIDNAYEQELSDFEIINVSPDLSAYEGTTFWVPYIDPDGAFYEIGIEVSLTYKSEVITRSCTIRRYVEIGG